MNTLIYVYNNNDNFIDPANGFLNIELTGGVDSLSLELVNDITGDVFLPTLYSFNGNNNHVAQFSDLSAGDYSLFAVDANGCEQSFYSSDYPSFLLGWDYVLDTEGVPAEIIINNFDGDGNGVYDHIEMPDCEFSSDGYIFLPEIISNDNDFSFTYFWGIDLNFDGIYEKVVA